MSRYHRSRHGRRRLRLTVPVLATACLLAGCGQSQHTHSASVTRTAAAMSITPVEQSLASVAPSCKSNRASRLDTLALSDTTPIPALSVKPGTDIAVSSRYHNQPMTFPTAHPAVAVCEITEDRDSDGSATVVYRVLRTGTISFFSSFGPDTEDAPEAQPEMSGLVTATRTGH